jgi:hypothetical protein
MYAAAGSICRAALMGALVCLFVDSARAVEHDLPRVPDRPFFNDLKCLALSPVYLPRNIGLSWWGYQVEAAEFFNPTTRLPSGRPPSVPEKIGFATVLMPVNAVVALPVSTVSSGVVPLLGHAVDLVATPLGRPLRFYRLDGSGFPRD